MKGKEKSNINSNFETKEKLLKSNVKEYEYSSNKHSQLNRKGTVAVWHCALIEIFTNSRSTARRPLCYLEIRNFSMFFFPMCIGDGTPCSA